MNLDQLQGKYARLKRELEQAYAAVHWDAARIDRIAEDLAHTERALAAVADTNPSSPPPAFA